MRPSTRKRVIITADDFGLHTAVNEAVEQACTDGVLTAASLMMGEAATADAVRRTRNLPRLRVGLHLTLADGVAVLPPEEIPDLVDGQGRFGSDMARAGIRFFCRPRVRRQLDAEIRAQFQAFADTGLALDHVNAHKHFHLHPTVLGKMLSIGREFGLNAVRFPHEPVVSGLALSRRDTLVKLGWSGFLFPWMSLLKARIGRAGVAHNDAIFGLSANGRMNESAVLAILASLPEGVSELYFHPATRGAVGENMAGYAPTDELAALTSPRVRNALARGLVERVAFSDLV